MYKKSNKERKRIHRNSSKCRRIRIMHTLKKEKILFFNLTRLFRFKVIESEEGNYEVPSDELAHKIIDQVEFYLSDEYLAKRRKDIGQAIKKESLDSIRDLIAKELKNL